MRPPNAAVAVLGLLGAALIFFGVAFLGAAILLALQPRLGIAGGAAVAGLVLLLPPCIWGTATGFRRSVTRPPRPDDTYESAAAALLSIFARDKPLLAVLAAAIFGATDLLLRRRR